MSAHRVCVQIFNVLDVVTVNIGKYTQLDTIPEYSYGIKIDRSHNDELAPATFVLPFDIVTSCDFIGKSRKLKPGHIQKIVRMTR